uniref:DDE Tnp4 domain-containing protein n=1 Tax=Fundulus heteroclitus TaxID=8078 RepID=A0A3Q2NTI7_FUNHE
MSYPFLRRQPVAEGARIIRRAFQINRVLRDRQDPLIVFSREGVIYIICWNHTKCSTRRSLALTTAQTVCIALRFFVSENLVKSAVCGSIHKMYLALKQFLGVFVVFPSPDAILTMPKSMTYSMCPSGFPKVIGAIHCTHIPFMAPPGPNEGDFVNRKRVHSVNVQMMCGSMHLITNVEAKWPGSVHDSRIFRESHLCTLFERGKGTNGILTGSCLETGAIKDFSRIPVVGVKPDDDLQPVHLDQPSGRAARERIVEHHF